MSKKTGQFAKVMIDIDGTPTRVMELREWSISGATEKVDANVAGTRWAEHLIGRGSWEGEATCVSVDDFWLAYMFDFITVDFYDHQDDVDPVYTGQVSMDFERSTPHDDLIESTLTFTGNGELVHPDGTTTT